MIDRERGRKREREKKKYKERENMIVGRRESTRERDIKRGRVEKELKKNIERIDKEKG